MGGGIHGGFGKRKTDFYVGENGQALPGKHKQWIGVSRRDKLLAKAKNKELRNAIDQMYRPGSFIGDGGTSSILKFEKRTGINVGRNGNSHVQKGSDMEKYIKNKVLTQKLTSGERKIATKLLKKLRLALVEAKGDK